MWKDFTNEEINLYEEQANKQVMQYIEQTLVLKMKEELQGLKLLDVDTFVHDECELELPSLSDAVALHRGYPDFAEFQEEHFGKQKYARAMSIDCYAYFTETTPVDGNEIYWNEDSGSPMCYCVIDDIPFNSEHPDFHHVLLETDGSDTLLEISNFIFEVLA